MRGGLTLAVCILSLGGPSFVRAAEVPGIGCVEVRTKAPNNPLARFWYRVPHGYDPSRRGLWRVLVIFGGRNCDGRSELSGRHGWDSWADLNGVFLVAPAFRDDDYWRPQEWSGRALMDALAAISVRYGICRDRLLFYGYSAGSQASNLFPAWRPDVCLAYVSHACGVFHEPTARMRGVAGLVTCGDADAARYVISRRFVDSCRSAGVPVVWRSFPNRRHDVPEMSVKLAQAFLAHHHWANLRDLGADDAACTYGAAFVGDDADGVYYPAGSAEAADVMPDDRVDLPSEAVAAAWGTPGCPAKGGVTLSALSVDGVDAVFAVPNHVFPDSRILVLLGGRGWDGGKTLRELGFAGWAESRGWCVIAPSVSERLRRTSGGVPAAALGRMVETLRRRHSLRPLPVFVFGYSAGGEIAALMQRSPPFRVAAWGVAGCGVFPDPPRSGPPAFVACGKEDSGRFAIGRTFACRYREAGGELLWCPTGGGHEPNGTSLAIAREFFAAVASGAPCAVWGEDDTRRAMPRETIDPEFLNPLHSGRIADLWRRAAP